MWLVILAGVPAAGKSFFRERFVRYVTEAVGELYNDLGTPMDEHEWAAKNKAVSHLIVRASSDDIIDRIAERQGSTYSKVFSTYKDEAEIGFWHNLRLGIAKKAELIIADRTFVSEKSRQRLLSVVEAQERDIHKTLRYKRVVFDFATPPADEWKQRLNSREGKHIPQSVLEDMLKRRTPVRSDAYVYDKVIEMINPENQPEIIKSVVREYMADTFPDK